MECYFAPMEGITGYVYRNAHHQFYGGIACYYTPFIAPNQSRKLTSREMNDILPDHNQGIHVVPQILTNRAEDFVWAAKKAQELGYEEVNLNLGCPSKTVVTKNRGAGFLAQPRELDRFLEQVTDSLLQMGMRFSIKTRIGKSRREEFEELLGIFNRYPLERLIIHPRLQTDFYGNHPDMETFQMATENSCNPLCYNGDIFSTEDFKAFHKAFPGTNFIMAGRGLLRDPALAEKIAKKEESGQAPSATELQRLKDFHQALLSGYQEALSGDRNVLFKMKELWTYLGSQFKGQERILKKIKKSARIRDYKAVTDQLFDSYLPLQ